MISLQRNISQSRKPNFNARSGGSDSLCSADSISDQGKGNKGAPGRSLACFSTCHSRKKVKFDLCCLIRSPSSFYRAFIRLISLSFFSWILIMAIRGHYSYLKYFLTVLLITLAQPQPSLTTFYERNKMHHLSHVTSVFVQIKFDIF